MKRVKKTLLAIMISTSVIFNAINAFAAQIYGSYNSIQYMLLCTRSSTGAVSFFEYADTAYTPYVDMVISYYSPNFGSEVSMQLAPAIRTRSFPASNFSSGAFMTFASARGRIVNNSGVTVHSTVSIGE